MYEYYALFQYINIMNCSRILILCVAPNYGYCCKLLEILSNVLDYLYMLNIDEKK